MARTTPPDEDDGSEFPGPFGEEQGIVDHAERSYGDEGFEPSDPSDWDWD